MAESCGFDYYSANNMNDLSSIVSIFVSNSEKPILLEIFVEDYDESDAYLRIVNENRTKTLNESISVKTVVKGIIGDKAYSKLKHNIKG